MRGLRLTGRPGPVVPALLLVLLGAGVGAALLDYRPEIPLGLDRYLPVPEDNPLTREKVALGERLFFDPLLSRDGSRACVSCHIPERAFSDTLPVAIGVGGRRGTRNAPPLINLAYGSSFFRDGSAASLEEQALHPIHTPTELDLPLDELERRLRRDPSYGKAFAAAFDADGDAVRRENVARALASYVRTLLVGDAPFDRFLAGDPDAISDEARRGFRLFIGRANCSACHLGPTFSDDAFHNTGIAWGSPDLGRYRVTGRYEDRGRFRTPTLRELSRTAPYMHDGSIGTLEEVIEFYDAGGNPNPHIAGEIRPLGLTEAQRAELLAFLRTLGRSD